MDSEYLKFFWKAIEWVLIVSANAFLLLGLPLLAVRYIHSRLAYERVLVAYSKEFRPIEMPISDYRDARNDWGLRGVLSSLASVVAILTANAKGMPSIEQDAACICSFMAFTFGVFCFWKAWDISPSDDQVSAVGYGYEHIAVSNLGGSRRILLLGVATEIKVEYAEVLGGLPGFRYIRRAELSLRVRDYTSDHLKACLFPFTVDGAGQFLEICRRKGAKVSIETKTSQQFKFAKMAAEVASRLAPPHAPTAEQIYPVKEMICSGCGAKSSLDSNATNRVCEYCGSADLTSV
jgi:hypothetical protein